jgi:hypothetical protein
MPQAQPASFDAAVGNREKLSEFVETTDVAFAHGACFCAPSPAHLDSE